jgi:hypothetical protein
MNTKYLDEVLKQKGYSLVINEHRYGSGLYAVISYGIENASDIADSFTGGDDDYDIVEQFYGSGNPIALYSTKETISELMVDLDEKCRRLLAIGWYDWTDLMCYVADEYRACCENPGGERDFSAALQVKISDMKARLDAVYSLGGTAPPMKKEDGQQLIRLLKMNIEVKPELKDLFRGLFGGYVADGVQGEHSIYASNWKVINNYLLAPFRAIPELSGDEILDPKEGIPLLRCLSSGESQIFELTLESCPRGSPIPLRLPVQFVLVIDNFN